MTTAVVADWAPDFQRAGDVWPNDSFVRKMKRRSRYYDEELALPNVDVAMSSILQLLLAVAETADFVTPGREGGRGMEKTFERLLEARGVDLDIDLPKSKTYAISSLNSCALDDSIKTAPRLRTRCLHHQLRRVVKKAVTSV